MNRLLSDSAKSRSDKTREPSDLVFIPRTKEPIGYCVTFPMFDSLPTAIIFIFNKWLSIGAFGRRVYISFP